MTTTEPTTEAVQQTLAEYERLAIGSGATVQIDPPEFFGGVEWLPVWKGEQPPEFARCTVWRDGIPTLVYVSWDESLPAVDDWRALWLLKPMKLFGAYTIRAALRRAFRDMIGEQSEPDELGDPADVIDTDRDWIAELAEASTEDAVVKLHADMKTARVVTVELEREVRKRLAAVRGPKLAEGGIVRPSAAIVAAPEGIERVVPIAHAGPTPADLASALEKLRAPQSPRPSSARRPQKPKPRS